MAQTSGQNGNGRTTNGSTISFDFSQVEKTHQKQAHQQVTQKNAYRNLEDQNESKNQAEKQTMKKIMNFLEQKPEIQNDKVQSQKNTEDLQIDKNLNGQAEFAYKNHAKKNKKSSSNRKCNGTKEAQVHSNMNNQTISIDLNGKAGHINDQSDSKQNCVISFQVNEQKSTGDNSNSPHSVLPISNTLDNKVTLNITEQPINCQLGQLASNQAVEPTLIGGNDVQDLNQIMMQNQIMLMKQMGSLTPEQLEQLQQNMLTQPIPPVFAPSDIQNFNILNVNNLMGNNNAINQGEDVSQNASNKIELPVQIANGQIPSRNVNGDKTKSTQELQNGNILKKRTLENCEDPQSFVNKKQKTESQNNSSANTKIVLNLFGEQPMEKQEMNTPLSRQEPEVVKQQSLESILKQQAIEMSRKLKKDGPKGRASEFIDQDEETPSIEIENDIKHAALIESPVKTSFIQNSQSQFSQKERTVGNMNQSLGVQGKFVGPYRKIIQKISQKACEFNFGLSSQRYVNRMHFVKNDYLKASTERVKLNNHNNSSFLNCIYQTPGYTFQKQLNQISKSIRHHDKRQYEAQDIRFEEVRKREKKQIYLMEQRNSLKTVQSKIFDYHLNQVEQRGQNLSKIVEGYSQFEKDILDQSQQLKCQVAEQDISYEQEQINYFEHLKQLEDKQKDEEALHLERIQNLQQGKINLTEESLDQSIQKSYGAEELEFDEEENGLQNGLQSEQLSFICKNINQDDNNQHYQSEEVQTNQYQPPQIINNKLDQMSSNKSLEMLQNDVQGEEIDAENKQNGDSLIDQRQINEIHPEEPLSFGEQQKEI